MGKEIVKNNKYFFVSYEKEVADSKKLVEQIAKSNWVSSNTIIVNCSPDYSSRVTQMVNHKLSYLNKNELYECIDLEMPYPIMSQIWNKTDKNFQLFDNYLLDWVRTHISSQFDYLFIDAGTIRGKNFTKVRNAIKNKLELPTFRFASLYVEEESIFHPDYFVEKYDRYSQGGLLFEWENVDNPNWDY